MRDDIFAQLTNSGDGSGFTNLTSGDGTAPPTLELGSGPFRLPTGTAGLTAGSGPASATTGGTAHATAALVEASPRDPAAAIAGLGKYYIHNGNEPFDRGPVERPTKPRTGASRFSKAIEHFKKKRASDGVPLPAVPYTPMSPRPEICGAILVTYSGIDFEQAGLSFDLGYENDRSCCGHLDDRLHQRRKDFSLSNHGLVDAAGASSWGQVLAAAADPDVRWDLLGPIDGSVFPIYSLVPEVPAQVSPGAAADAAAATTSERGFEGKDEPESINAHPRVHSVQAVVHESNLMTPPWSPSAGSQGSTPGAAVNIRSSLRQSQELLTIRKNAAQRLAVLQSPGLHKTTM